MENRSTELTTLQKYHQQQPRSPSPDSRFGYLGAIGCPGLALVLKGQCPSVRACFHAAAVPTFTLSITLLIVTAWAL